MAIIIQTILHPSKDGDGFSLSWPSLNKLTKQKLTNCYCTTYFLYYMINNCRIYKRYRKKTIHFVLNILAISCAVICWRSCQINQVLPNKHVDFFIFDVWMYHTLQWFLTEERKDTIIHYTFVFTLPCHINIKNSDFFFTDFKVRRRGRKWIRRAI